MTPDLRGPRRFQVIQGVNQRQGFARFIQVRALIAGRKRQIFETLRDSVTIQAR
jgi:hypothetical protein